MEDPRIGLRHWANFDPNHLKDHLRDHPAVKLLDVSAERDAAVAERDTAIAERKTAYAERDAALLQREVAYADRNTAWIERDAAIAALAMVRADKDTEAAAKLMQMVNMAVHCPVLESDLQTVPKGGNELGNLLDAKQSPKQEKQGKKVHKDNPKKRKAPVQAGQDTKAAKSSSKKKRKQQMPQESNVKVEKHKQDQGVKVNSVVPYDTATTPIPYCSCTGTNQQCYRWGNGGWQSACCTNFLSMYPLPMNPVKRGSRVPGRKMSGGAFKKLLERLSGEGINITCPVDLKNHWAKHGTNRYVTIK